MPEAAPPGDEGRRGGPRLMLEGWQSHWNLWSLFAAWVVSLFASFLNPPPSGTNFKGFLVFLVALLTVIIAYFFSKLKNLNPITWFISTVLMFSLSFFSVVWYYQVENAWTAPYSSHTVIIGYDYTPAGAKHRGKYPDKTIEEVILDFGGETEMIWTRESLNNRRTWMGESYLLCGLLLTVAVMVALQLMAALQSGSPPDRSRDTANERPERQGATPDPHPALARQERGGGDQIT